jgi:hypothetical protein
MRGDQGGPAPEDRERIPQATTRDDDGQFTSADPSTGPQGGPAPEDRERIPQATTRDDEGQFRSRDG